MHSTGCHLNTILFSIPALNFNKSSWSHSQVKKYYHAYNAYPGVEQQAYVWEFKDLFCKRNACGVGHIWCYSTVPQQKAGPITPLFGFSICSHLTHLTSSSRQKIKIHWVSYWSISMYSLALGQDFDHLCLLLETHNGDFWCLKPNNAFAALDLQ